MNVVELQQLKLKAMQAASGSHFIFPSDTPLEQIAFVISFLKESIIVLKNNYSDAMLRTIIQNTSYPHQLFLEAGLSEHQFYLVCENVNINHHLLLDSATPVSKIQCITKYLQPYTAILKTLANFPLMSSLALLSSLKKGCFFGFSPDFNPQQIRNVLSFVNHDVILALPKQLNAEIMHVINQFAPFETCFFIERDFDERHTELILNIRSGRYCMFHPNLPLDICKQMAAFIAPEVGIRMHLRDDFAKYMEILPYLSARAVVYLEHYWKEGYLGELLQSIPDKVAIRLHKGFSVDTCVFVINHCPAWSILYVPYEINGIMLEYIIANLMPHSIICVGPQFEYACESYVNIFKNMKQGWWMPDPLMIEGCASHLARNLPADFKIILHPAMSAPTALLFASELKHGIELNVYSQTSIDLMRFFISGIESKLMFAGDIDLEIAKKITVFLNKTARYIPNPSMVLTSSQQIVLSLSHFSRLQMPKHLNFDTQLELIKCIPDNCILNFDENLTREQVERILAILPDTVGINLPKRFGLASASYLGRAVGLQNIIYLPHQIESLLADLLVLSLKDEAKICLGSHFPSEDELIIALMARNKKAWVMLDPTMPHSRLRYLLNHAPENLRLMLHPLTDFRFAQIIGKELTQTIHINIHPQTPPSLLQNFLLSYKGKIIMDGLTEKQTIEVLSCGHELQFLQLSNQLQQEDLPKVVDALPPTGILHVQVQDLAKAKLVKQLAEQLKPDQVLSLADDVPIDYYEMIVSHLPEMAQLFMSGNCRIEKLHIAFRVLKSNTVILLSADIKESAALAIIEKMGARGDLFLMFHPMMPHIMLKKLLASLHSNTKVMLHPNSSEFFLKCFRINWNPNCILTKHYLMPLDVCNSFLSEFDKPIQLLMHPLTDASYVPELQTVVNSHIFHCLSPNLGLDVIQTLAKFQADEVCISATQDCPEKPIFEFMQHLHKPSTIVCHPNIGPLQAALVSHNLPANVCLFLESSLSGDSLIELVRNCRPFHTLVFNPKDKESYLKVHISLAHIQENVSIMFAPDTSLEYMTNLLSKVNQNCYLVFHPQMSDFIVSQSLKKMSPQLKVLLHPEASIKQAITIAFNLTRSKSIYYFPGTSEEQMQAIHKGVSSEIRFLPYVRTSMKQSNAKEEEKALRP